VIAGIVVLATAGLHPSARMAKRFLERELASRPVVLSSDTASAG
jgi:hypothetical protein